MLNKNPVHIMNSIFTQVAIINITILWKEGEQSGFQHPLPLSPNFPNRINTRLRLGLVQKVSTSILHSVVPMLLF